ncbi:MAG: rubrerythrin family protein [Lachnospiraceae bacterium]|nr:rubrerythrin family protein [Lachnospiraceae bacterium]
MSKNPAKAILHSKWFAVFEVVATIAVVATAILMINFRTPSYDSIPKSYGNLTETLRVRATDKQRYEDYAIKAEQEGNKAVKRIFLAAADMQEIRIQEEYELLNSISKRSMPPMEKVEIKSTAENLSASISQERYKAEQMYTKFIEEAGKENFRKGKGIFDLAKKVSAENSLVFERALEGISNETRIYGCKACGKLTLGEMPDKCSICKKGKDVHKEY